MYGKFFDTAKNSNHAALIEFFFFQKEKLRYKGYSHTDKKMIAELRHGETQAGGQDIWSTERLHIPPCPPTMESSAIMELTYNLHVGTPTLSSSFASLSRTYR